MRIYLKSTDPANTEFLKTLDTIYEDYGKASKEFATSLGFDFAYGYGGPQIAGYGNLREEGSKAIKGPKIPGFKGGDYSGNTRGFNYEVRKADKVKGKAHKEFNDQWEQRIRQELDVTIGNTNEMFCEKFGIKYMEFNGGKILQAVVFNLKQCKMVSVGIDTGKELIASGGWTELKTTEAHEEIDRHNARVTESE